MISNSVNKPEQKNTKTEQKGLWYTNNTNVAIYTIRLHIHKENKRRK